MVSLDRYFTRDTLIACHDAGAAQMILDNTSEPILRKCRFKLKGPAKQIFSVYAGNLIDTVSLPPSVRQVICGTGWQDRLEFETLREAALRGIPNIALVDRATNFNLRFSRDGEIVEPSMTLIPQNEISKLQNCIHIGNLNSFIDHSWERQIDTIRKNNSKLSNLDSLFIGQPIVHKNGCVDTNLQYDFLRSWLASQPANTIHGFRPHPSDKTEVPSDLSSKISISDNEYNACEDISRARKIVGIDSYLLEIAATAGKQTFQCSLVNHKIDIKAYEL